jgi:hypothetical protein
MIEALELPKANLKLRRREGVVYVWCVVRKKDLVCTPEEWVRQHVIHYLINHQNVSLARIASEYALEYNGLRKRADIVVFDIFFQPVMIVECKATTVQLTSETLQQIASYNAKLQVPKLWLTNGIQHRYCLVDLQSGSLEIGEGIPVV